jgi:hypothetical protein
LGKSFADIKVTDAGVDTLDFLAAAEGVVELFTDESTLTNFELYTITENSCAL